MNIFMPSFKETSATHLSAGHYYSTMLVQLTCWAVCIGYSAFFESSKWQATPGKRLMGLIVTDLNGNRISFARAFCRYLGKIVSFLTFFIGFLIAAFTDKKQALHDKMASTLVFRKPVEKVQFEQNNLK